MGTKAWGLLACSATAGRAFGLGGALLVALSRFALLERGRSVFFGEPQVFLPSAISANERPVATEASISMLASPSPGTANSSFSLISSQLLRFDGLPRSERRRIRAHLPDRRSPWSTILTLPFLNAASRSSSCGSHSPASHICTVPAP